MQYTENFLALENENFQKKKLNIFLNFAQNIDCGYTLEPPRRGSSNEYTLCFGSKIRKIGIPLLISVLLYKVGYKGVYITRTYFPDGDWGLESYWCPVVEQKIISI